ncbi:CMF_collapsed_G0013150.mRNA.1.CDS.1 [Saccharomyces cerevisiae]|nr:CMF_collapsed_G0013150.mRNA.1.CDS.1 [Saccharomyces cerevisiae]
MKNLSQIYLHSSEKISKSILPGSSMRIRKEVLKLELLIHSTSMTRQMEDANILKYLKRQTKGRKSFQKSEVIGARQRTAQRVR